MLPARWATSVIISLALGLDRWSCFFFVCEQIREVVGKEEGREGEGRLTYSAGRVAEPGVQVSKLARFDILFALTSDKNATFSSLFGARGVVDSAPRNLSDFTPITIPKLPWKPSLVSIIALLKQVCALQIPPSRPHSLRNPKPFFAGLPPNPCPSLCARIPAS